MVVAVVATFAALPVMAQSGIVLDEFDRIRAEDGAAGDEFGFTVALFGDCGVAGAPFDDDNGLNSGSVYVFVRNASGGWLPQSKLLASDGAAGDGFGASVAISGDAMFVGSLLDGDNGANSGSVYVFTRNASGVWTQQTKLLALDGAAGDFFGGAVAIAGDTAIVGAEGDDGVSGIDSGSVYVFVRDAAGVWTQQAKLLANDGAVNDSFGAALSIDANRVLVGAPEDDDNGSNSGSAYVFVRDAASAWTQQAKLLALDGTVDDEFGASVSIDVDTAIVGARFDDDLGNASGSAYIFMSDATGLWAQNTKLLAGGGAPFDQFGNSVVVEGKLAVVGAWLDNDNGIDSGSAYLFIRNPVGVWKQQAKLLASDGNAGDEFGFSIAQDSARIFVGAPFDDNNGVDSGSVYVFDLTLGGSGDFNSDGKVDNADLSILIVSWGGVGFADLNRDGIVDGSDLSLLLAKWGLVPSAPPPI